MFAISQIKQCSLSILQHLNLHSRSDDENISSVSGKISLKDLLYSEQYIKINFNS